MIVIVNYGSGNVRAIGNIYDRLKVPYIINNKPAYIVSKVSKIILPGVGIFDETMSLLVNSGFRDKLDEFVLFKKVPVLGICVGMQILADGSDEGELPGLGWIPGRVKKFDKDLLLHKPKLPHLGWNSLDVVRSTPLLSDIDFEQGFYFIHSYYFECASEENILTTTEYGLKFASALSNENIFGTQFHPEKSHDNGVKLLRNFANM